MTGEWGWRRGIVAAVLVLGVYVGLSFISSPRSVPFWSRTGYRGEPERDQIGCSPASLQTTTPARRFAGVHPTDRSTIRLFDGVDLRVTHWEADA